MKTKEKIYELIEVVVTERTLDLFEFAVKLANKKAKVISELKETISSDILLDEEKAVLTEIMEATKKYKAFVESRVEYIKDVCEFTIETISQILNQKNSNQKKEGQDG